MFNLEPLMTLGKFCPIDMPLEAERNLSGMPLRFIDKTKVELLLTANEAELEGQIENTNP